MISIIPEASQNHSLCGLSCQETEDPITVHVHVELVVVQPTLRAVVFQGDRQVGTWLVQVGGRAQGVPLYEAIGMEILHDED